MLPSKLHTQRFLVFWETHKGARFSDMHGTTLHLFVKAKLLIKKEQTQKNQRVWKKKRRGNFFFSD